ncbi:hypothetical protein [Calothrix sp. CCY 0018]|uniref:hypothetical protein n=1 Tax=Calothrix sp. CCY 0018 TaxID=3103864 RepID=UPI0039C72AA8
MAEFYNKGERVVVLQDEYRNQHGKINSEMLVNNFGLRNKYRVKLDNGNIDEFFTSDIEDEDLGYAQISEIIENITKKVNQVASKLPGEMKTELPTHIGYLENALLSKDKPMAITEYSYVTSNLKRLSEQNILSPDFTESTRIDFEKIDGAIKRVS